MRVPARKKREFTPPEKKDSTYWEKRYRNNESAKRSREKRCLNDAAIECQLAALRKENLRLRLENVDLRARLGLAPWEEERQRQGFPEGHAGHAVRAHGAYCVTAGQRSPPGQGLLDFVYVSRKGLCAHPEVDPMLQEGSPQSLTHKGSPFFRAGFSTVPLNYHHHKSPLPLPAAKDFGLPVSFPQTAELRKVRPPIKTPDNGGEPHRPPMPPRGTWVDAPGEPPVARGASALPYNLRVKGKYLGLGETGDPDVQSSSG